MSFEESVAFIELLKKGDEKAYLKLVDKYYKSLQTYANSLVGDYAMSQDIVQNVFLKCWQFRKRLSTDYPIKHFLQKSVYNEFINTYQKNKSMMLLQLKYIASLDKVMDGIEEPSRN